MSMTNDSSKPLDYSLPEVPHLDVLTNVLRDIGVLDKIKSRLFNYPNQATEQLADLLKLIGDSYTTILDACNELMNLSFKDPNELRKAKIFLFNASHSHLGKKIEAARARCGLLEFVYDEYLNGWFSGLEAEEKKKLEYLFKVTFREFDSDFKDGMLEVENFLKDSATKIFEEVNKGHLNQAEKMVAEISESLNLKMKPFEAATRDLLKLESEYVKLSRHDITKDTKKEGRIKKFLNKLKVWKRHSH